MYVSHMRPPYGTSIYDVEDPRRPRLLASLEVPIGWHSHKVRVRDGLMIVNYEKFRSGADDFGGGLGIYDVSRPDRPRLISHWKTGTQGGGVHRYDFDGRYAYISPTAPGYIGNIVKILTCAIRRSPRKWGAGGFPASTRPAAKPIPGTTTCRRAATIRCAWATACTCRTGITACSSWTSRTWRARAWCRSSTPGRPIRIPRTRRCPYRGCSRAARSWWWRTRTWLLRPSPPAFTWFFDITDERQPMPISTFQVDGVDPDGQPQEAMSGCHQPAEKFSGNVLPFAWFARGLRLLDISDPFRPREVGCYEPDPPAGCERASSNDVTTDDRGLLYLLDRQRGLDIIESSVYGT